MGGVSKAINGVSLPLVARRRGSFAMAIMQFDIGSSLHKRSGICVIGHFPEYRVVASRIGGFCFNLPAHEAQVLTADQLWRKNRQFLQNRLDCNDMFLLADRRDQIKPGSSLEKEFEFLAHAGAQILPIEEVIFSRQLDQKP